MEWMTQSSSTATSYSDSELSSNSEMSELEVSLTRHSHFFSSPRCRFSMPLVLDGAASPMLTALDGGSSSERLDRDSGGGGQDSAGTDGTDGADGTTDGPVVVNGDDTAAGDGIR